MENTDTTETTKDWRQAWRDFADRVSRPAEACNGLEPIRVPVEPSEGQEGEFRGFGSPPGKF